MGAMGGLVQLKSNLTWGLDTQSGCLASWGLVAPEEGLFGFGLFIPLPYCTW